LTVDADVEEDSGSLGSGEESSEASGEHFGF